VLSCTHRCLLAQHRRRDAHFWAWIWLPYTPALTVPEPLLEGAQVS
jgi:hypothetical protein